MIALFLIIGIVQGIINNNEKIEKQEAEGAPFLVKEESIDNKEEANESEDALSEITGVDDTEEPETDPDTDVPKPVFNNQRFFNNSNIPPLNGKIDNQQCLLINEGICVTRERILNPLIAPLEDEKEIRNGRLWSIGTDDALHTENGTVPEDRCNPGYQQKLYPPEKFDKNGHRNIGERCPMYLSKNICCAVYKTDVKSPLMQNIMERTILNTNTNRRTKLYPKCDKLISPMICAGCSQYRRYMLWEVFGKNYSKSSDNAIILGETYFHLRICHSLARRIYDECKYAFVTNDEGYAGSINNHVVEPGMTFTDFLRKLKIDQFNTNDYNKDEVGINCWGYDPDDNSTHVF